MPDRARKKFGTIATAVVLLALLAAALWYAASAFVVGGPPMPTIGYVAMAGGIVISLAVGFGLMGLLFYSSRHGYDEPFDEHPEPKDGE
jgi:hypothetical protein